MTHRRIVEPLRGRSCHLDRLVAHDVAHQPDEHQVHRMLECTMKREDAPVIARFEIVERLRAAARVERLAGTGRVLSLDGSGQHRL